MNPALSPSDQQILTALQQAVTAELERKALLEGPDAPQPSAAA